MAGLVISLVSQPQRDKDSDNGASVMKGWTEDLLKLNMRGCWTTELMWEWHFTQCVRFYHWHLSLWFSRSISYYVYWYSSTQLLKLAMPLSNVSALHAKICRTAHSPELNSYRLIIKSSGGLILWRVVLMASRVITTNNFYHCDFLCFGVFLQILFLRILALIHQDSAAQASHSDTILWPFYIRNF